MQLFVAEDSGISVFEPRGCFLFIAGKLFMKCSFCIFLVCSSGILTLFTIRGCLVCFFDGLETDSHNPFRYSLFGQRTPVTITVTYMKRFPPNCFRSRTYGNKNRFRCSNKTTSSTSPSSIRHQRSSSTPIRWSNLHHQLSLSITNSR